MGEELTKERIARGRIVAILRGDFAGRSAEIVEVLSEAGITAVEVTLNSPGALATIKELSQRFGAQIAVGAGTVLRPQEVEQAADAGAGFIVSPNRNINVIAATKQRGLISLPGCFTPSEIVEALDAGADAAKIFPAQMLGAAFIKAIRGPLSAVRTVPTGGVTPEAAREYFAAGAWAVGVGSELLSAANDLEQLRHRTLAYVAAAHPESER